MSLDESFESMLRRVFREELQSVSTDDRLLTAAQVAEMLGYKDIDSVYRLKKEKKLRAINIGENSMRFRKSEVERFIEDCAA